MPGLVDLLEIGVMPVLLGGGLRLFEHRGVEPIRLRRVSVSTLTSVRTDPRFRMLR